MISIGRLRKRSRTLAERRKFDEIRGTWWLPTKVSDDVIALGNTSLTAKPVRVRISDSSGGLLIEKQATLASHTSQLFRLN